MERDLMSDFTDDTSVSCVPVAIIPSTFTNNTHSTAVQRVTATVPNDTLNVPNVTSAIPQVTCNSVRSSRTAEQTVPSSAKIAVSAAADDGIIHAC